LYVSHITNCWWILIRSKYLLKIINIPAIYHFLSFCIGTYRKSRILIQTITISSCYIINYTTRMLYHYIIDNCLLHRTPFGRFVIQRSEYIIIYDTGKYRYRQSRSFKHFFFRIHCYCSFSSLSIYIYIHNTYTI